MNEHCYDTAKTAIAPIDEAIMVAEERIERVLGRLTTLEARLAPVLFESGNHVEPQDAPQFESAAPLVCAINRLSDKIEMADKVINRITNALAL